MHKFIENIYNIHNVTELNQINIELKWGEHYCLFRAALLQKLHLFHKELCNINTVIFFYYYYYLYFYKVLYK